jgi:hypothetical protein
MGTTASATPLLRKSAKKFFTSNETPAALAWIDALSPLHFRLFVVDLHAALSSALIDDGNGGELSRTLEEWQATAEVDANPELAKRLRAPRQTKQYCAWKPE